jgi:hypothetical protein
LEWKMLVNDIAILNIVLQFCIIYGIVCGKLVYFLSQH